MQHFCYYLKVAVMLIINSLNLIANDQWNEEYYFQSKKEEGSSVTNRKHRAAIKNRNNNTASSLFDVTKFDKILNLIFPASELAIVEEIYDDNEELFTPDAYTPEELNVQNTPPP